MALRFRAAILAAAFFTIAAPAVRAAETQVEIGTSLAGLTSHLDEGGGSIFGVPSSGLGLVSPGVYVSVFATDHVAIEPQLGLLVMSNGGHTDHYVNFAGQLDYFLYGASRRSPYFFGSAGVIDASGAGTHPKLLSTGAGYRIPVGDRLAFRFDMRYQHMTDNGGNYLMFTASIGGLLGAK